ncbi:hypothetical protein HDU99_010655 [Rhizoclosmatium hyalinum]|nr:hypothetical protein HDU99_010655 [Rhizoclosmatium hyalinum]
MIFVQHQTLQIKASEVPLYDWIVCRICLGPQWRLGTLENGINERVPEIATTAPQSKPIAQQDPVIYMESNEIDSDADSDATLELEESDEESNQNNRASSLKPVGHKGSPLIRPKTTPSKSGEPLEIDFIHHMDTETREFLVHYSHEPFSRRHWITEAELNEPKNIDQIVRTLMNTSYNFEQTNPTRYSLDWMNERTNDGLREAYFTE